MELPSVCGSPVRLAVLGAGGWARQYHLPTLAALRSTGAVEIAGLWNRTTGTAAEAARQFGVQRVYRSLDELVDDDRLDGYVVVVDSGAVFDVVSALLARPLPMLVEKPPGRSYREALALADRVHVPNVVGFNRRYMPLNRRFRELAGTLTGAHYAGCRFHRHGRGAGRFIGETGIHGINFIEFVGGPIGAVRCLPQRAETGTCVAWLEFETGMAGLVEFLPRSGASVERYEVHGPESSLYLESPTPYCSDAPGRIVVHHRGRPAAVIAGVDDPDGSLLCAGLIDEYRDFLAAIADPAHATASNFRNACNTMRIAEAIEAAGQA